MTMPSAEIEMIMAQLKEMRAESKHNNERLHDKLDTLNRDGCAKAAGHTASQVDHEKRLRLAEGYIHRQAGQVAMIGGGAAAGVSFAVMLGKFLLSRIGGE